MEKIVQDRSLAAAHSASLSPGVLVDPSTSVQSSWLAQDVTPPPPPPPLLDVNACHHDLPKTSHRCTIKLAIKLYMHGLPGHVSCFGAGATIMHELL